MNLDNMPEPSFTEASVELANWRRKLFVIVSNYCKVPEVDRRQSTIRRWC